MSESLCDAGQVTTPCELQFPPCSGAGGTEGIRYRPCVPAMAPSNPLTLTAAATHLAVPIALPSEAVLGGFCVGSLGSPRAAPRPATSWTGHYGLGLFLFHLALPRWAPGPCIPPMPAISFLLKHKEVKNKH